MRLIRNGYMIDPKSGREGNYDILIDTAVQWIPEEYGSRVSNTPSTGWNLKGRAVRTICDGMIVY